jgi:hypothetical protein
VKGGTMDSTLMCAAKCMTVSICAPPSAVRLNHNADLTHDENAGGDGLPKALAEIFDDDDLLARLAQLPNDVTADITGAAGD